jgi:hypothetical protein
MKKLSIAVIGVCLILCGCATTKTTVIPQERGKYTVIATGSDEGTTNEAAMKKAAKTCKVLNKTPIVLKHETRYQGGMSKKEKDVLNTAARVASAVTPGFISGASSDNDYKATIVFRCK